LSPKILAVNINRHETVKELTIESFLNVSQKATTTPMMTISITKVLVMVTNNAVRGLA
jgi:hypothetical protein